MTLVEFGPETSDSEDYAAKGCKKQTKSVTVASKGGLGVGGNTGLSFYRGKNKEIKCH